MSSAESTLPAPAEPQSAPPATPRKTGAPAKFGATDLGLVLTAVIWGGHYTVLKYGLRVMEPFTFSAIRMVSALIILSLLAMTVKEPRPSFKDIRGLMLLGLIGNGLYQLMFMIGMTTTRAGIAALIIASSPAWVAIIGRLMGRERVSSRAWMGIGLQLVGVACVVLSTHALDGGDKGAVTGTILILLCGVLWSLYTVLLQPYTTRVHPLHLSTITLSSGALLMTCVALPGLMRLDVGAIAPSAWAALSYSTILAMIIAYLLYYQGIRVIGPTRTAVYGNLQPVFAIIIAWVLLREAPGLWQWVGTLFIMGGLLLSRSAPVKPITDTHPIP